MASPTPAVSRLMNLRSSADVFLIILEIFLDKLFFKTYLALLLNATKAKK